MPMMSLHDALEHSMIHENVHIGANRLLWRRAAFQGLGVAHIVSATSATPRAVFHRVWCTVFTHVVALLCAEKKSYHEVGMPQLAVS